MDSFCKHSRRLIIQISLSHSQAGRNTYLYHIETQWPGRFCLEHVLLFHTSCFSQSRLFTHTLTHTHRRCEGNEDHQKRQPMAPRGMLRWTEIPNAPCFVDLYLHQTNQNIHHCHCKSHPDTLQLLLTKPCRILDAGGVVVVVVALLNWQCLRWRSGWWRRSWKVMATAMCRPEWFHRERPWRSDFSNKLTVIQLCSSWDGQKTCEFFLFVRGDLKNISTGRCRMSCARQLTVLVNNHSWLEHVPWMYQSIYFLLKICDFIASYAASRSTKRTTLLVPLNSRVHQCWVPGMDCITQAPQRLEPLMSTSSQKKTDWAQKWVDL